MVPFRVGGLLSGDQLSRVPWLGGNRHTVETFGFLVVSHLVIPESEVVETFSSSSRFCSVDFLKRAHKCQKKTANVRNESSP